MQKKGVETPIRPSLGGQCREHTLHFPSHRHVSPTESPCHWLMRAPVASKTCSVVQQASIQPASDISSCYTATPSKTTKKKPPSTTFSFHPSPRAAFVSIFRPLAPLAPPPAPHASFPTVFIAPARPPARPSVNPTPPGAPRLTWRQPDQHGRSAPSFSITSARHPTPPHLPARAQPARPAPRQHAALAVLLSLPHLPAACAGPRPSATASRPHRAAS